MNICEQRKLLLREEENMLGDPKLDGLDSTLSRVRINHLGKFTPTTEHITGGFLGFQKKNPASAAQRAGLSQKKIWAMLHSRTSERVGERPEVMARETATVVAITMA